MNRCALVVVFLTSIISSVNSLASPLPIEKEIDKCRLIIQSMPRLECYDKLNLDVLLDENPPRFAGKRTVKTELFSISEPTVIRYQSDGAIFVLAVHDKAGEVVQNLHIGGGGEDSYLLDVPGDYFLRVNGSTTWRIWLDKPVSN